MNRDQIKKNLPTIQAFADGKILQYQSRALGGPWSDLEDDTNFNFNTYDYRVKPEPKTVFIIRNCFDEIVDTKTGYEDTARFEYLNKYGSNGPYTREEYVQVVK